ncbi:ATP12 family protein [Mesorhizobium sp. LHD-90]|uniref:ATP12 family chaperone protein n=1 Tax=Mesorhizobium sp. LHD-90 TaxID=3071414 RepID=UPI0027DFD57C|nr:ATP12 family protein [Mesorhizobium sp. LHD-90]MDQ6434896.1 ATP12 family protein [Mesorhizobium sp. LHD-90]
MRDLLNDLDATRHLSDPDPVRRAQIQMKTPLPKRFYAAVAVEPGSSGHVVKLDGKLARTPARAPLELPSEAAARLVADEFDAQQEVIDPVAMPVMRLANTAIDGVAREADAVLEDILRFASSDLLCYRADAPEGLVARQNEAWDGVIDWARDTLGARLNLAEGIIHVEQPREAIAAIGLHLRGRAEPFRLAALHLMTSLTGSALLSLAVEAGELDAETAWAAAHVDEDWQVEHWGQDSEAMARRAARRRDMLAAARLVEALNEA